MTKRELDMDGNYIPVIIKDGGVEREVPSHIAYPMRPIIASIRADKKLGDVVIVERDDCTEPMIYTKDVDGYQYWHALALHQAGK